MSYPAAALLTPTGAACLGLVVDGVRLDGEGGASPLDEGPGAAGGGPMVCRAMITVLMDDETIRAQAGANTRKQFVESPDLSDAVTEAVLGNQTSHHKMADYFFTDDRVKIQLVKLLGELVHESLKVEVR
jgi:hypothetical protein